MQNTATHSAPMKPSRAALGPKHGNIMERLEMVSGGEQTVANGEHIALDLDGFDPFVEYF
jgi:hypothetical protein